MSCKYCHYWEGFGEKEKHLEEGWCRRFPPLNYITERDGTGDYYHPTTKENDWCGEELTIGQ